MSKTPIEILSEIIDDIDLEHMTDEEYHIVQQAAFKIVKIYEKGSE